MQVKDMVLVLNGIEGGLFCYFKTGSRGQAREWVNKTTLVSRSRKIGFRDGFRLQVESKNKGRRICGGRGGILSSKYQ